VFLYAFRPGYESSYAENLSPTPVTAYEKLAKHYGIPSVNMGCRVSQMARDGKLVIKASAEEARQLKDKVVFTHDGTYVTPAASALYAQMIAESLAKLAEVPRTGQTKRAAALQKPLSQANLERARQVRITDGMLTGNWQKLTSGTGIGKHFEELWFTNAPGAKLTFKFRGTAASLFNLMGPDTGAVRVTVDGLDKGRRQQVDRWCYYQRISALALADGLAEAEHTVTVELLPDAPDRSVPIEEARKLGKHNPKDFEGVALRFGWIRIVGELVE